MATKKAQSKKANAKGTSKGSKAATRDKRRDGPEPQPKEGSKIAREIAALAKLGKTELWKKHKEVFGHETRSCNTSHLRNVIGRRLAEIAEGKVARPAATPTTERLADTAAASGTETNGAAAVAMDPRLPKAGDVTPKFWPSDSAAFMEAQNGETEQIFRG